MSLVNIYGPNNDDPGFYDSLQTICTRYGNQNIIIVGDWNLLIDPSIDEINYKHTNNLKARLKLLKMINDLNLYYAWSEEYQDKKLFT